ncbi:MAG: MarR family winged helix-turn-helix transcriptional regulator [Planctomycetes bacterium]|nr:MarR family winged helix-turn-helix transcriptional regulator [Planctomycetota bacterium]
MRTLVHKVAALLKADHIDVDSMSAEEADEFFTLSNEMMTVLYRFVLKYNDYINARQDYCTDESLTMLEAHLLTDICDYPDSTVTSLAARWYRSVSATSQTIRKLIQKDLVTRVNSKQDAKVFHLHPTEKGRRVSEAHKRYDILDTIKTLKSLRHSLDQKELAALFNGLNAFTELLKKD